MYDLRVLSSESERTVRTQRSVRIKMKLKQRRKEGTKLSSGKGPALALRGATIKLSLFRQLIKIIRRPLQIYTDVDNNLSLCQSSDAGSSRRLFFKEFVYRGAPHSHISYKIEAWEGLLFAIARFYCNTIGEVSNFILRIY